MADSEAVGAYQRVPLSAGELCEIPPGPPTPRVREKVVAFSRAFQVRVLRYFAALKLTWEKDNPGKTFPGLCAEVDSVTGRMRPLDRQRAWSWGDCRALGIWSYFLLKGWIPAGPSEVTLLDGSRAAVDLRAFYGAYSDHLYRVITERLDACGGKMPFLADIATNRVSDDPRNIRIKPDEFEASHVFLATALFNYAILRGREDALGRARRVFDESVRAGLEFRFVNHLTKKRGPFERHGSIMVTVGAAVDVIKAVEACRAKGERRWDGLVPELTERMLPGIDYILDRHYDPAKPAFWESNLDGKPYVDEKGHLICDPGHTAELCGFLAEIAKYLPAVGRRWGRDAVVTAAATLVKWTDRVGYGPKGVMYKNVDVFTGQGVADVRDGGREYRTAPWWNVRELAAASLRLLALTKDESLWEVYRRAFHAGYRNYPNAAIGGCFLQTLDAGTLAPLPFFPATGNLDPMHDSRAREREIEALEEMGRE